MKKIILVFLFLLPFQILSVSADSSSVLAGYAKELSSLKTQKISEVTVTEKKMSTLEEEIEAKYILAIQPLQVEEKKFLDENKTTMTALSNSGTCGNLDKLTPASPPECVAFYNKYLAHTKDLNTKVSAIKSQIDSEYASKRKVLSDERKAINLKYDEQIQTAQDIYDKQVKVVQAEQSAAFKAEQEKYKQTDAQKEHDKGVQRMLFLSGNLHNSEKYRKKRYDILTKMMAKVGYQCETPEPKTLSRCWSISSYVEGVTNGYNADETRKHYAITDEELVTANKLAPYIQEYKDLNNWLEYDIQVETEATMLKEGITYPYSQEDKYHAPKTPRPDGSFGELKTVTATTTVTTSTPIATTSQPELPKSEDKTIVTDIPKKETKKTFGSYFVRFVNWFKHR